MTDADRLAQAFDDRHPEPYANVTRAEVQALVDAFDPRDRSRAVVDLMRLAAALGVRNGHTAVHAVDDHPRQLRTLPLVAYEFADGTFVVAGADAGREIVGVDGTPIDVVQRDLAPLVAHDNEWTIRARRPSYLVCPDVLEGLGLAGAELELSDERTAPRASPRFLERHDEPRWTETLGRVLYVAYSVTRGDVSDLAAAIDDSAGAVVLDLRLNGGGDNTTYGPLLDALTRVRELRVLIGRVTFSAAMQLVVDLERRTSALFVGEPTGASPNHFGDAEPLTLTQTQVRARVATIAWTTAGEDERLAREPDVAVALDSEAFFAGRDPVLEAALETLD